MGQTGKVLNVRYRRTGKVFRGGTEARCAVLVAVNRVTCFVVGPEAWSLSVPGVVMCDVLVFPHMNLGRAWDPDIRNTCNHPISRERIWGKTIRAVFRFVKWW